MTHGTGGAPAIIVAGPPATGKSTLAGALARRLPAALIDQDVATAPLTDVIASLIGTSELDDPRLVTVTRTARYETIIRLAETNLRLGVAVVLAAPFSRERGDLSAWHELERRLKAAGGIPTLVWLQLPPEEIRRRMHARSADRDTEKLRADRDWLATVDLGPPVGPSLALDATAPLTDLVEVVLRHVT
jgi:predicted kinase